VKSLETVTAWLAENKRRGILGEFGASKNEECLSGLTAMVETLRRNSTHWLGFAYWAGGDWWPETEGNNIRPTAKGDRPQLQALGIVKRSKPSDAEECSPHP
jgi:endoglucanase